MCKTANDVAIKSWSEIARKEQIMPKDNDRWLWLILAGRGFGKTRTGSETVMDAANSGIYKHIGLIGKTLNETRDVMVEGTSGLLSTTIAQKLTNSIEHNTTDPFISNFKYYKSLNKIKWQNGAIAYLLSGDNYEKLRGYQFDFVWIDEFAKYKNPREFWKQILFTLRLGNNPKAIITTTPKPIKILKELSESNFTHLTRGSTFDNKDNLSPKFIETMIQIYKGTRLGKQELEGEITLEKENTLWKRHNIRYKWIDERNLSRVVIGIDPAVTSGENSDETGIIIAGTGYDELIYIIEDLSGKFKPPEWAKIACRAVYDFRASCIVAETNNGGDLVREMIRSIDPNIPFKATHAIKGKVARAEPISMLYESNRVFHIKEFTELENQMCDLSYDEKLDYSPDRVDALVWAVSTLKERESYNISTIDL